MIIDTHAYWDTGHMSLAELSQQMQQHGIERVILSPPCTEVYEPDKSPTMYAVQRVLLRNPVLRPLAEMMSRSFYDKNDHLRLFWRLFTKNSQPINKVVIPDNTGLLRAIAPFDGLHAWYWLNPTRLPDKRQIQDDLQHPRVVGIKFHAYWHRFTAHDVRPLVKMAEADGLPIYFILGFGWLTPVIALLREFPSVKVILGYGGFPYFDGCWERILSIENALIDFTSLHIDQKGIADAIQTLGATRCLYGSDCPYNFKDEDRRFSYRRNLERITQLGLNAEDLSQILGENASRVLSWKL